MNSSDTIAPKRSTAQDSSTGKRISTLYLREILGVPWLQGMKLEGKDSSQRPITMTRQRVSVLIEGDKGAAEVPDAMIKAIEYAK